MKGPGGIEESVDVMDTDKAEASSGTTRKRPKRATAGANVASDLAGVNRGVNVGVSGVYGNANTGLPASAFHYPYQLPHLSQTRQPHHRSHASNRDRSMMGAAGGLANVGNNVSVEKLPPETSRCFLPHVTVLLDAFSFSFSS